MIRLVIIAFSFLSLVGCENGSQDLTSNIPTRPLLYEPPNKAVLSGKPRNAILKWDQSKGPGNIEYQVEVHFLSGWDGNENYCQEWEEGAFGLFMMKL